MGTTRTCTHHFLSHSWRWIRWNLVTWPYQTQGRMGNVVPTMAARSPEKTQRVGVVTNRRKGTKTRLCHIPGLHHMKKGTI